MKRLSITVDPDLLEESRRLAGVKTKREAIEMALQDFVRNRRLQELAELEGSDLIEMSPAELRRWRETGMR